MNTNYSAQVDSKTGKYTLQFETSNLEFFKIVEKACHTVIDKRDRAVNKERSSQARTVGHI